MLTRLPEILAAFGREHPQVELQLTVELSGTLHRQLAAGRLDLVLAKRRGDDPHGDPVWRDALEWIGAPHLRLDPDRPVPLVVYPPPDITRARALEALEEHGRAWRIACTSTSLNALVAAARAGLGVMAHSRGLVPQGLAPVTGRAGLPELGGVDFVLLRGDLKGPAQEAAEALAASILAGGDRLHRGAGGRDES
ncbi:LysR substrate-binding domain-containing protein [Streptomyces pratensis]|uniref:LysR substrate-binding domain-containing protein n=1 Tax=Streptomyces pratensis TaxID=1169025 RepID=UPI003AFB7E40